MASIENLGETTHANFREQIRRMEDVQLVAQDLVQQGAIHAMSFLLKRGATEETAGNILASLRENARLVREEAERRGKLKLLFTMDQTGFS